MKKSITNKNPSKELSYVRDGRALVRFGTTMILHPFFYLALHSAPSSISDYFVDNKDTNEISYVNAFLGFWFIATISEFIIFRSANYLEKYYSASIHKSKTKPQRNSLDLTSQDIKIFSFFTFLFCVFYAVAEENFTTETLKLLTKKILYSAALVIFGKVLSILKEKFTSFDAVVINDFDQPPAQRELAKEPKNPRQTSAQNNKNGHANKNRQYKNIHKTTSNVSPSNSASDTKHDNASVGLATSGSQQNLSVTNESQPDATSTSIGSNILEKVVAKLAKPVVVAKPVTENSSWKSYTKRAKTDTQEFSAQISSAAVVTAQYNQTNSSSAVSANTIPSHQQPVRPLTPKKKRNHPSHSSIPASQSASALNVIAAPSTTTTSSASVTNLFAPISCNNQTDAGTSAAVITAPSAASANTIPFHQKPARPLTPKKKHNPSHSSIPVSQSTSASKMKTNPSSMTASTSATNVSASIPGKTQTPFISSNETKSEAQTSLAAQILQKPPSIAIPPNRPLTRSSSTSSPDSLFTPATRDMLKTGIVHRGEFSPLTATQPIPKIPTASSSHRAR